MKKFLILLLILGGCSTAVPVKRTFPEVPAELKAACPDLQKLKPEAQMSDILSTVTQNYTTYHECRIKHEAWVEWYDSQKKIFDEVK
jgi:hypothetical protein